MRKASRSPASVRSMATASLTPMTSTLCLIRFIRQVFRLAVRYPQVLVSEGYYVYRPLFVAEGDHRVDAHGAAGWDVAGGQSDSEQNQCNGDEGERVGCADS